jgi:nitrous oxidase accessory protein NosD
MGEPRLSNFLIAGNDLADQYWGRGITISGARDVTIRQNKIAGTMAAGIFLSSEPVYRTSNVHNVIVENNDISRVQTASPPWDPIAPQVASGQGAIDIHGYSAAQVVTGILVKNNYLHQAGKDGIFIRGNSTNIALVDNNADDVGRDGIRIETAPDAVVFCSGNNVNGVADASSGCSGSVPVVTGSSL